MATFSGSEPLALDGTYASGWIPWIFWDGSEPLALGGGASSFNAPQITNITPPIGTNLATTRREAKQAPVQFDVTDIDSDIASAVVWAKIDSPIVGEFTILIYNGSFFVWPFEQGSTVTEITNGLRFSIRYNGSGGWPGNITELVARAVSSHGEVAT